MSFATLVAAVAVLPAVFALPSANLDLQLNRRQIANAATDPNALPANWTLVGCFSDATPNARTLQTQLIPDNSAMTPLLCTEFCSGTDFTTPFNFAGTEFTSQCFCDFNIQGTAIQLNDTACNFPCGGDTNLTCGGAGAISVYQNHNANVGPIPANKAKVGTWTFDGCVTDVVGNNTRSLTIRLPITPVTVETCTAACQQNGFNITGLEFAQECWCGNSLLVPNITAPVGDCSQSCLADHTELCGAANRLTLYTNAAVVAPTTVAPTTVVPTTTPKPPTTVVPTTTPTTVKPPTTTPTTVAPTTVPTTVKPTTVVPTTVIPTTVIPTTVIPTTVKPTTTTKAA